MKAEFKESIHESIWNAGDEVQLLKEIEEIVDDFAEQRSVGFAEWVSQKHYKYSRIEEHWYCTLRSGLPPYTTTELYQEYLKTLEHGK